MYINILDKQSLVLRFWLKFKNVIFKLFSSQLFHNFHICPLRRCYMEQPLTQLAMRIISITNQISYNLICIVNCCWKLFRVTSASVFRICPQGYRRWRQVMGHANFYLEGHITISVLNMENRRNHIFPKILSWFKKEEKCCTTVISSSYWPCFLVISLTYWIHCSNLKNRYELHTKLIKS